MLTDDEKREIDLEMSRVRTKRAAACEALKIVQRRSGWVSDEELRDVADCLGMSLDEVDSIATFYNLVFRRPVGRHVILLCDSVSCWLVGNEGIREHRSRRGAGETEAR
jgi:NADH-quinone oxidoreductase subunit E